MKVLLVLICLTLVSCATVPLEPDEPATRALVADSTLPPMKTFQAPRPQAPRLSNGTIAADFLDLHFMLESGRDLPVLTRFEGPITVAVTGAPPPTLAADLARLLNRLRGEAGIDIRQIGAAEGTPNI
ncbi:MAG: DUF2927 domain-containing protein, partial [Rhodobacteraceae bacterium]